MSLSICEKGSSQESVLYISAGVHPKTHQHPVVAAETDIFPLHSELPQFCCNYSSPLQKN